MCISHTRNYKQTAGGCMEKRENVTDGQLNRENRLPIIDGGANSECTFLLLEKLLNTVRCGTFA